MPVKKQEKKKKGRAYLRGGFKKRGTYTLNSIPLLLRHGNSLRAGGKRRVVVVALLAEQREELLRVLRDELRELRVARAELLQDGLEHLRLLLHHLAELLELRVIPEEVEVAETCGGPGTRGGGGGATRLSTASTTALLGSKVEEVDVALLTASARGGCAAGGRRGCGSRSAPLLLDVLGDALHGYLG